MAQDIAGILARGERLAVGLESWRGAPKVEHEAKDHSRHQQCQCDIDEQFNKCKTLLTPSGTRLALRAGHVWPTPFRVMSILSSSGGKPVYGGWKPTVISITLESGML